jgi:hypothetical protein
VIPLSRRYSVAAIALIAIAVLAVALHAAFAAHFDPCADPAQLLRLDAYGHRYRVEDRPAVAEMPPQRWVEGQLPAGPGGSPLWFRIARSDEPFAVFSQPFLMVTQLPEDLLEVRELRVGTDVLPIHRIFDDSLGEIRLTRYFFALGVAPVAHPISSGIGLAWQQLVHGTLPLTVFAVSATGDAQTLSAVEAAQEAWISAVWSAFRRACQP